MSHFINKKFLIQILYSILSHITSAEIIIKMCYIMGQKMLSTINYILIVRYFKCSPNHDMGPILYMRQQGEYMRKTAKDCANNGSDWCSNMIRRTGKTITIPV